MLRWTIIILIGLAVLIGAAAVAVHLVLQSEWLGQMAMSRVSEQIGMDVNAESFDVRWGGDTAIHGITIRMPLTGEVILSADTIRLGHAMIPLLVFGRPIDLRSIEIENPHVNVRQYESGRWNVQDVWTRVRAGLDRRKFGNGSPRLPQVVVREGLIHITEPNDVTQTIGPANFQAQPEGALLWTFDLELPAMAQIEGRLVRGRDWAHEAGFTVEGIAPLLNQLVRQDLAPISAAGRWEGSIQAGRLDGRLRLTRAVIGPADVQGEIRVQASADGVMLRPRALVVSEPNLMGRDMRLVSGAVRITPEAITIVQLAAEIGGLAGRLDGRWDLETQVGRFSGSWACAPGLESQFHGAYEGYVRSPRLGRVQAEATLTARADTEAGRWSLAAQVQGAGADWQRSEWQVVFPRLAWSLGQRHADLSGTGVQVDVNWPRMQLASMRLPIAQVTRGGAEFNAATRQWSTHLETDELRLPGVGVEDLNIRLTAQGDMQAALISEFRIVMGPRIVRASGELSFTERGFQDVSLSADWPMGEVDPMQPQAVQPIGRWHLGASVTGRMQPLAAEMEGKLTGQNIAIGKQTVPRMDISVHANADTKQIQVATRPFNLLSGLWQATGRYDLATELTQVNLIIDDMSLAAAAGIAGTGLESRGSAQAKIQLTMPRLDIQEAVATGRWNAKNVDIPPLRVQTASGAFRIADGLVQLHDIRLEQEGGRAYASAGFRMDRPEDVAVEFRTEAWPVRFQEHGLAMFADSQADLRANVITRGVQGEIQLSADVLLEEQDLARVRATVSMDGQVLSVRSLYVETLGGFVEGVATVPLDRWTSSTAQLHWEGIEPGRIERWATPFERFEGVVSGSLTVEQAEQETRPLEPMRLVLDADIADGRFGAAQIDVGHVVGYLGPDRLLIDEALFDVLGGRLDLRARVSRHVGSYYASVTADFNELNLDQFVHVVDPNALEHPGLLSGWATVLSSSDRRSLGGEAQINLTQSDLISNPIVGTLHSVLNLRFGERQATGTGELRIRLEGSSIIIPGFVYFNRGVEIRGAGEVEDVYAGADSPVNGYAVASTRVLRGISLPGVAALDRLLATFQAGAASVMVGGTIDELEVNVVPLPVVLGSFRRLLWAQLRQ